LWMLIYWDMIPMIQSSLIYNYVVTVASLLIKVLPNWACIGGVVFVCGWGGRE
jgi:hypothetical protein